MRLAFLQPLLRLKPQRRLAALSLVGVAMCAVPLIQVLRYQGQEIEFARTALLGLDPVAGAVAVQRSLMEHRDVASQWLRGQPDAELPRRQRQGEVDARLAVLSQTLEQHANARAVVEAAAMTNDWRELVKRIVVKTVLPADSDAAHRLLVEQAIQVIDLVADALPLRNDRDAVVAPVVAGVATGLPRLSAALLRLPLPTAPVSAAERKSWAAGVKATEAMLEAVLQPLGEARPLGPLTQDRQLADAVSRSLVVNHAHLRLLMDARATPEGLAVTQRQALQAHFAVVNAAQATLGALAESKVSVLETQRTRGLLGIGVLALLAAALALTLLRSPSHPHDAPTGDERPRTDGHWPVRRSARHLIERLRGAPPVVDPDHAASATKPPERARRPKA